MKGIRSVINPALQGSSKSHVYDIVLTYTVCTGTLVFWGILSHGNYQSPLVSQPVQVNDACTFHHIYVAWKENCALQEALASLPSVHSINDACTHYHTWQVEGCVHCQARHTCLLYN